MEQLDWSRYTPRGRSTVQFGDSGMEDGIN